MLKLGFQVNQRKFKFIPNDNNFLVYLGVNNQKVDYLNRQLKGQELYEYGVEWGLAHPEYLRFKVIL